MPKLEQLFSIYEKMKKNKVVIYGAGKNGRIAYNELIKLGIDVLAVADKRVGVVFEKNVTVSLSELLKYDSNVVCLISTGKIEEETFHVLIKHFRNWTDITFVNIIKYNLPNEHFISSYPYNHYESPYLTQQEIEKLKFQSEELHEINMNDKTQEKIMDILVENIPSFKKLLQKKDIHYKLNNGYYDYEDALILNSMIRLCKPKRIIEIGSGYSSLMSYDTNKEFFHDSISIECIEPYPERLIENLNKEELEKIKIYKQFVQDVDISFFEKLEPNDILFIDSSHVAKAGGDVLYEYFDILPRLKPGVMIHIHDIFSGFQYPLTWIKEGRCYNEAYIVRALLTKNNNYEIVYFSDMMHEKLEKKVGEEICGGACLWLKKC